MLFFLCIKTNIWNATLDQQPINNHHELVIKLSSSTEMGSGGARKTKKEIHVTEQYKHSGRFGRLLKWINLSSWNKESLWKHKWNRKKAWVKKNKKYYSLKAVKQGYYAFYQKQWLCLHHERNLILTCLNKRNCFPIHINICSVFSQYVIQ